MCLGGLVQGEWPSIIHSLEFIVNHTSGDIAALGWPSSHTSIRLIADAIIGLSNSRRHTSLNVVVWVYQMLLLPLSYLYNISGNKI